MEEEVKKWLNKASRDIDSAKYNFEGNRFEEACFFAQQAAEKSLKALDLNNDKRIIKTHDLLFLCKRVNAPII